MKKYLKAFCLFLAISAISFVVNAYCEPPSYFDANGGQLVPYKEGGVQLGERCVAIEGFGNCSCIGMIYWY